MRPVVFCCLVASFWTVGAYANINIPLLSAGTFAVLGGTTVTNTGPSVINGNLGVFSGTAITGFPPGTIYPGTGRIYPGDAVALQAQTDLTAAYDSAAGEACGKNLSGQNLGGLNLAPGVYCFDSSAQLTGILTLVNPGGLSDPSWVFQINSALITASNSAVEIANIGSGEVFWQVGSSATLGTGTTFYGNILALTSITMDTGATIPCGRALAQNGAVTLDDNVLDNVCSFNTGSGGLSGSITPEPQLIMPLGVGIVGLALLKIKRTKAKAGESTI